MLLLAGLSAASLALGACSGEPVDQNAANDMATDPVEVEDVEVAPAGVDYATILAGNQRSEENRTRDQYRHPAETLDFFGLEPGMTVVEIAPGGGWYTEILAGAVGPDGKLVLGHSDPESSDRSRQAVDTFQTKLDGNPVYGNTTLAVFSPGTDKMETVPAGTADMVLTFRNAHNFYMADKLDSAMASFFTMLKPGGVLGVVDHRLPEEASDEKMTSSGYMKTSTIVAAAEKAGFTLEGESEVNANPNDTADYEKGVWSLPPTLTNGDTDREKYAAIGESDRMTLRFRKPEA